MTLAYDVDISGSFNATSFVIASVGSAIDGNLNPLFDPNLEVPDTNGVFNFDLTGNSNTTNGISGGKNCNIYTK